MMILFRLMAGLVVWSLLTALVLGCLAGTGYLWCEAHINYLLGNLINHYAMVVLLGIFGTR